MVFENCQLNNKALEKEKIKLLVLELVEEQQNLEKSSGYDSFNFIRRKKGVKKEDIHKLILEVIKKGNIYQVQKTLNGLSVHQRFFLQLPRQGSDFKGRELEVERLSKVLRFLEELYPPSIEYFFSNNDIATKVLGKYEISNELDLSIKVERIEKDRIVTSMSLRGYCYDNQYKVEFLIFK